MAAHLLFCTASEAKPFIYKAMDVKIPGTDQSWFNLVETRADPENGDHFKRELKTDEEFGTEFIGASEKECQDWAMEMQGRHNFIGQDLIAIADARSASDDTLLMQFYGRKPDNDDTEREPWPQENDSWHSYRVDYREAHKVIASFDEGDFDAIYPVYFGRKEELTDENGVFDVARAESICSGKES
ncbi:hypothetical protein F4777DRAFT_584134 [Nemania sp. FL0916]|nr:hypothetical protein F4777DRAFT_584134 [Nemania sp. FL0916]